MNADATIALTSGYEGRGINTAWVQDPDVGVVVECTKVTLMLLHRIWHDMQSFSLCEWQGIQSVSCDCPTRLQR